MPAPREIVYLDNASTTRLDPEVLEAMLPYLRDQYGNASSIHGLGRQARAAVETARESVARLFEAEPSEIVFTSGGTEADATALLQSFRRPGRIRVVSSSAEHHAVLRTCERMRENGLQLTLIPVTASGSVDPAALDSEMDDDVALVSLMHGNNETGVVSDIGTLASIARRHGALYHCDTVQTAGKLPLSSGSMLFDFAAASAHKLHGPKGIGALYVRKGEVFEPLVIGGAQERGRRGGTENVASIVGFGVAADIALRERSETTARWRKMREACDRRLSDALPGIVIHGGEDSLPHIVSVSFPWNVFAIDGEALLMNLDLGGVAVSSGSACTAGSPEPSHVIQSMGYDRKTAAATVRLSFGRFTTADEALHGANVLVAVVQEMLGRSVR